MEERQDPVLRIVFDRLHVRCRMEERQDPVLRIVFDNIGHSNALPYGRMMGQRYLVAESDDSPQSPWSETPLNQLEVMTPMHEMSRDDARDFIRDRFTTLAENGCVMFRYEEMAGGCRFGLLFAPGVSYMSFEGCDDMTMGGSVDELVDYVMARMIVDFVMDA